MALLVGLDVGSTTTKVYAMHEDMTEAWWGYRRHGACQTASVRAMLGELAERFPHESLRVAVTGSGARWAPRTFRRWSPTRSRSAGSIRRRAAPSSWAAKTPR